MGRIRTIRALRATYRNWVSLALTLSLRAGTPARVVLEDGSEPGPPARRGSLFSLAAARLTGWRVRGDAPGRVRVSPAPALWLHARWSEGFDIENAVEVFSDRVYAFDVRGKLVLDIGASFGDSPLFFASEGAGRVLALEPNSESFALAEQNVRESSFGDRITLLRMAASTKDGAASLRSPISVPNAASLLPAPAAEARWTFDRTEPVSARSLGSLIVELSPDRVGLLKVDCQGLEYELMASVAPSAWARVDAVILEFSDGPRSLPDLLSRNGFGVTVTPGRRGYLRAVRPDGGAQGRPAGSATS